MFRTDRCFPGRPGAGLMGLCLGALLFAGHLDSAAQTRGRAGTPVPPAKPAAAQADQAKFKAIWEPVNIKEDLDLMSVHFTTADEGWVAGGRSSMAGGVIYHTKDGGATWDVQLGSPQSSDRAYSDLRFVGPKTGYAVQSTGVGDHQLLRTTDGQNWAPIGTVGQHRTDYQFTSPDVGFYAAGTDIFRTRDGGRKWDRIYHCAVKVEISGLTRDVNCQFAQIAFVDPTVGYAMSQTVGGGAGLVVAKTADAGTTWTPAVVLPGEDGKEGALHFLDANTGVMRAGAKVFRTTDAGKTWTGVPGQIGGKPDIAFADAQVGWMMRYTTMLYSVDGGKTWSSREIAFPTSVAAFSLVERDRGYAVGAHGMVYRYRVVPIAYASKGMIAAPAMPTK